MSVTQYVGARYVPLFANPIDWDITKAYEPLTIVYYQGNSYTSKQSVPTGTDINNETYWALTGNYNAQIEQYRAEVTAAKNEVDAATATNTTQDAQIAGTSDSGLKTLITNESTARGTKDTALDAQLAGTADSGLKTLITNESTARGTKDTALDAQLAGTTDSGLKTLIDSNTNNINEQDYQPTLYGICHNNANKNQWFYISTSDLRNVEYIDTLPSKNTTYDYSDATNLFEKNGVLYYPQQDHRDIYATTDGEVWNENYAINYPAPLGDNFYQWAPMLFEDESGNVKFALARQYNSDTYTNALGLDSALNFRIDVFDCTMIDNKINISDNYITVLSDGSHIDPYIIYDANYGYVMACVNGITNLIEIYNGSSLSTMSLKFTTRLVGCEAPKLIKNNGAIILYSEGFNIYTGSGTTAGNKINRHFYFTNTISFCDSQLSYGSLNIFNVPTNYRHIAFIQNSKVLAKYAKNKAIVPYTEPVPNIIKITISDGTNDIYPITAPFHIVFDINGLSRTVTVHPPVCAVLSDTINYILCRTNQTITVTNGTVSHVMSDSEIMPCYTSPSNMYFEKKEQ